MRQCTCGRSKTYPYCDNTHKIKKEKEIILDPNKNSEDLENN
jgi:CDGSH-type Zn-finger protein